jgi:hypothetical protein
MEAAFFASIRVIRGQPLPLCSLDHVARVRVNVGAALAPRSALSPESAAAISACKLRGRRSKLVACPAFFRFGSPLKSKRIRPNYSPFAE